MAMQNYKLIMDELRSHPCKLVVAVGIVNPFGPTLAALFNHYPTTDIGAIKALGTWGAANLPVETASCPD